MLLRPLRGVAFFEGYALIGAKQHLHVFDLADPAAPVHVMESEILGDLYGLDVVGHQALIATSSQILHVIDLLLPCTDSDPCTLDGCHTVEACVFDVTTSCDDLDPCTADNCEPFVGCQHVDIPECLLGVPDVGVP